MKKCIVVKTNLLRNQKFYKIHKTQDSWSIDKAKAHRFASKRTAEKIAAAKNSQMSECWKLIIEYGVEVVNE